MRYEVTWEPWQGDATTLLAGNWMVIAPPDDDLDEAVTEVEMALAGHGTRVRVLRYASTDRAIWARHLAGNRPAALAGIVWVVPPDEGREPSPAGVPYAVADTLALVQALEDTGIDTPVWAVTRGAVAIRAGDALPDPGQAGVWGLGRVVALEVPHRWGGLIDLDDTMDERAWASFCDALVCAGGEDQFAVRDSRLHVRRLDHVPRTADTRLRQTAETHAPRAAETQALLGAGTAPGWRPTATVLVTGGLGQIGRHVARWLAGRGAGHLVLAGRRGARTPGTDGLLAELAALGTEVTVAACDVSDRRSLACLLDAIPAHRPLTAIVHAAGALDDGVIGSLSPERLDGVFAAKAGAAWHLHELTRDRPLDRFVLFSSMAGIFGAPGQGNSAAADAFLDALAHHRSALGLPATAVAWGPWAQAGTARGVGGRTHHQGIAPLAPHEALAALGRALDRGPGRPGPAHVVGAVDWNRFVPAHTATRPSMLFAGLTAAGGRVTEPVRTGVPERGRLG
ncbi:beta-ketoacyl reductase [Sphaerisporangium sp. NPDC088356]|uniref:beta-ketoacyl reductase n=1 Tax=Sphaerisporangium sp. NPDC088356 TaxID=3154871 RepID=UPI00343B2A6B